MVKRFGGIADQGRHGTAGRAGGRTRVWDRDRGVLGGGALKTRPALLEAAGRMSVLWAVNGRRCVFALARRPGPPTLNAVNQGEMVFHIILTG